MTDTIAVVLAALAIFLQVLLLVGLVLGLFALVSARGRALLVEARATFMGQELWIAWAIALVATLGSLYFSEVADFVPCRLCWFQRIAMYPLVAVLLVGALRSASDLRTAFWYAIPFPLVGAAIAGYHIYIERNPEAESAGCKVGGGTCSTRWIEELGYVTIPTLAITAFAAIAVLLVSARSRA